ncbi:MAG: hypothetical protein AAF919_00940 [Pseudomonadota bacterium]
MNDIPGNSETQGLAGTDVAALLFTSAWLGLAGWLSLTSLRPAPDDVVGMAATAFGIIMPVALIWVAAGIARVARRLRIEGAQLRAEMNLLRRTGGLSGNAHAAPDVSKGSVSERAKPVDRSALVLTENASTEPQFVHASGRETADEMPLPMDELLRALDFPESEHDQKGFALLRKAMSHAPTAQLITATQNVLTLLREDGVRVRTLTLGPTEPNAWRAFAQGMRGPEVDPIGAIQDEAVLRLADRRLHEDPTFRTAAHHFLRNFDRFLYRFTVDASDDDIRLLSRTRTGRAFMLVGGAIGVFA